MSVSQLTDKQLEEWLEREYPLVILYTTPPEMEKLRQIDQRRGGETVMSISTNWQRIETAPRDGTEILVWREGWGQHVARWDESEDDGFFRLAQGGCILGDPTHWMPLPKTPDGS